MYTSVVFPTLIDLLGFAQSHGQFHSGLLLDLSRPPLASSMLEPQFVAPGPPSAATRLASH